MPYLQGASLIPLFMPTQKPGAPGVTKLVCYGCEVAWYDDEGLACWACGLESGHTYQDYVDACKVEREAT